MRGYGRALVLGSIGLGVWAGISTRVLAQERLPLGQWRTHYSYRQAYGLWGHGEQVYSIAGHSLLMYDGATRDLSALTRVQGLSDGEISALGGKEGLLVIGYTNGGIDVWTAAGIRAITLLRDLQRPIGKRVRSIFFSADYLYVGGDFGLLEFRLGDLALVNNYFELGEAGISLPVQAGLAAGDSLFLATPRGIISAHKDDNKLHFENWKRPDALRGPKQVLCRWGAGLASMDTVGGQTRIFRRLNEVWQMVDQVSRRYHFMRAEGDDVFLGYPKGLDRYSAKASGGVELRMAHDLDKAGHLVDAWVQGPGLWVADSLGGLGQVMGAEISYASLRGPSLPVPYELRAFGDELYAFFRSPSYPLPSLAGTRGFSYFREGLWGEQKDEALVDVIDIARHPQTGDLYLGTSSAGVWRLREGDLRALPMPEGSTALGDAVRAVSALGFAASGRLLVGTREAGHPFLQYAEDEGWSRLSYAAGLEAVPTRIEAQGLETFWCVVRRGTVDELVYLDLALQRSHILLKGNDFTPARIHDIAAGEGSTVWISTPEGLYVFSRIREVLGGILLHPELLRINGVIRLRDIDMRGIALDGGRRVWVGSTEGLWRVDEARAEVFLFDSDNSPLPEGSLGDIAYAATGEVFVSTAVGLLSYRSLSSSPAEAISTARIFPNPVHADYTGWVGIAGLPDDVLVQISALGGHLLRVVVSVGGTASWDLHDRRGRRVPSGVYMVHIVDRRGEERYIGKIAVLR